MSFYVVIPARYASTRLPGKPLATINGQPMIQHVYQRAQESRAQQVVIATDDARVERAGQSFGAQVCMTSDQHESGTDRLQEVVTALALPDDAIVVNVQGDEPLIPEAVINQVADNLAKHPSASVATLCEPIESEADFRNPNIVKVVMNHSGMALYFSRAPIPYPRDAFSAGEWPTSLPARRHIGIYAYRVGLLHRFITWERAPLEQFESLEQLRVLWRGESIHVAEACEPVPGGVDTPGDLERVRSLLLKQ
ncbi:3-deoxy-manno-octulosonate cytidylyltransferase [Marinimicrobium sp. ARAG 43.8]|uniref:3-deoxy-manno-octulosonate cytidylyltransferase n=1 Tax=Marinimicrobium sp. ARAG 43.8 TaxID=3418719 RepID=UPI003CEE767F